MYYKSIILQLMQVNGIGSQRLWDFLMYLHNKGIKPDDFDSNIISEQLALFTSNDDLADSLSASRDVALILGDELDRHDIEIVTVLDSQYPTKLRNSLERKAPPVLFLKGSLEKLDGPTAGFCGSRHASELGMQVAYSTAQNLAKDGINILSGYAQGVDLATHTAALATGGFTTIVLACGMLNFQPKSILSEYFDDTNHAIISEFPPRLPWMAHSAMKRNQTIVGLSDVMILIESKDKGGTFEAGKTTVEMGKPLFVVEYSEATESPLGNKYFLDKGARALRRHGDGRPILEPVLDAIHESVSNEGPQQTSLF